MDQGVLELALAPLQNTARFGGPFHFCGPLAPDPNSLVEWRGAMLCVPTQYMGGAADHINERETVMPHSNEEDVVIEPVAVRRKTAAAMLDCSETTIWRLCKAGLLSTIRVGADERVTTSSIKQFAQRGA